MTWLEEKEEEEKTETPVEEEPKKPKKKRSTKSDYIAVRGLTYERVKPRIRVEPGEMVPAVVLEDPKVLNNLLSKGAIKKR
jgi:hypothetical protein